MKKRRGIWALVVAAIVNASLPMLISIGVTGIATTAAIGGIAQLILFKEDEEEVADKEEEEDLWDDDWGDDWIDYDGDGVLDPPTGVPGVDGQIPNGVYPSDPKLKVRAQLIELAKEVGKELDIDPKSLFVVAYSESKLRFDYDDYDNSTNPDIYRDLIRPIKLKSWSSNGHELDHFVNRNYKIGPVIKDINHSYDFALGPFQFETDYIDSELKYVYTPVASGGPSVSKEVKHMSQMDSSLGIMRPNPMYIPDGMYNMASKLKQHMNNHRKLCESEPRWKSVPKEIQDIILTAYACDAYRGDMSAKKTGKPFHDVMVSFWIDVYEVYGSFDFMAYPGVRELIMGTQRNNEWDGTLDKPITINGVKYTQTLLQEMTAKTKTGINYMTLFNNIKNNGSNGQLYLNKYGLAYGMEGLIGARIYDEWSNSVKQALTEEGKWNNNNGNTLPNGLTELQQKVVDVANDVFVKAPPYVSGGEDLSGMDCSGLVYYVFNEAGVKAPRSTADSYYNDYTLKISKDELVPGDLVFRYDPDKKKIGHVWIYLGKEGTGGSLLGATTTGQPPKYRDLEEADKSLPTRLRYGRVPEIQKALDSNSSNGGSNNNSPIGSGGIPGIQLPTPSKGGYKMEISSQYGWRNYGGQNLHKALDISGGGKKVPIYSILDGEVVQVSHNGAGFSGYGNVVRIKTEYGGNKYVVQYNHLDSFSVKVGQKVKAGQQIAIMGSSGGNYAVHLDLEVELNSPDKIDHSKRNRINPLILYGYNPSVHKGRKARNEWLYAQGFNIQCNTTCTDSSLLKKNTQEGYSTFNCKNHLGLSSKYPD